MRITIPLASAFVALLAACGASYHGPTQSNFDGTRFRHHMDVPERGATSFFKWITDREQEAWPDWAEIPTAAVPPTRSTKLRVQFINHATVLVQLDGVNILTDPIWAERASPISWAGPPRHKAPGLQLSQIPPIDLVLISHNHYDHLSVETLAALQKRDKPVVLIGLGNQAYLADQDIKSREVDWWETLSIAKLEITFVPVQHWSSRSVFDRGESLWGGYFIRGQGGSVYFAGDTGYGPHFAETRKRLGSPDVALLPVGAYEPRWFMAAHHMNPDDAAAAHLDLGAKQSMGIHWGTFQLTDEGMNRPVEDLSLALRKYNIAPEDFQTVENGGVLK
jgi:L-ascorbate metabolism protein UlaG (beta-lactamase superfamily)